MSGSAAPYLFSALCAEICSDLRNALQRVVLAACRVAIVSVIARAVLTVSPYV